jgi:hypothetical protein
MEKRLANAEFIERRRPMSSPRRKPAPPNAKARIGRLKAMIASL